MIRTVRPISETSPGQLHELSIVDAAEANRDGSITSVANATALLRRHREHADLNAFITVNEEAVLEASLVADEARKAGKPLGLLHGVSIGIKDSVNTHDLPTSVGGSSRRAKSVPQIALRCEDPSTARNDRRDHITLEEDDERRQREEAEKTIALTDRPGS